MNQDFGAKVSSKCSILAKLKFSYTNTRRAHLLGETFALRTSTSLNAANGGRARVPARRERVAYNEADFAGFVFRTRPRGTIMRVASHLVGMCPTTRTVAAIKWRLTLTTINGSMLSEAHDPAAAGANDK